MKKLFEGIFKKQQTPEEKLEEQVSLPTIEEMEANRAKYIVGHGDKPAQFKEMVKTNDIGMNESEQKSANLIQEEMIEYDPSKIIKKSSDVWEDPRSHNEVGKMDWDNQKAA